MLPPTQPMLIAPISGLMAIHALNAHLSEQAYCSRIPPPPPSGDNRSSAYLVPAWRRAEVICELYLQLELIIYSLHTAINPCFVIILHLCSIFMKEIAFPVPFSHRIYILSPLLLVIKTPILVGRGGGCILALWK